MAENSLAGPPPPSSLSAQSPMPPPPSPHPRFDFWRSWSFRLLSAPGPLLPLPTLLPCGCPGAAAWLSLEIKSPFGIDSSPCARAGVTGFSFYLGFCFVVSCEFPFSVTLALFLVFCHTRTPLWNYFCKFSSGVGFVVCTACFKFGWVLYSARVDCLLVCPMPGLFFLAVL